MNATIPTCTPPQIPLQKPKLKAPDGAWDTHFHVLGPQQKYPFANDRKYSPADALLEDYFTLLDHLGIARAMVVHPNTHGFDMSVTIDAIEQSNGRLLGVAKLDSSLTKKRALDLDAKGFRGVRFAFNPQHGGEFSERSFQYVMDLVSDLGWFCEMHTAPEILQDLMPVLVSSGAPIVIDHFGRIDVKQGTKQKPFQAIIDLIKSGQGWVKISGADRISSSGKPYEDVIPFGLALINASPTRIVWGSDWPHTGYFSPRDMPSDVELFDFLETLVPDAVMRKAILVDNPSTLINGRIGK